MSDDAKSLLTRFYDEINAGNLGVIDELVADDFVEHEEFPGISPDKEGVRQFFLMFRSTFPDMRMEAHEVVAAQVNDAADILADPHFQERTLVELTGNQVLGKAFMPGPVLHLGSYAGPSYHGVPRIGEHTDEVLSEILDAGELASLRAAGVIGAPAAAQPA